MNDERKIEKRVAQPSASRASIQVARSVKGKPEENIDEFIEVQPFVVEPAYIKVEKGLTLNLGNYESARVTVGVTLPCYVEELEAAGMKAERMVEARLMREIEEIRSKPSDEDKE